MAIVSNTTGEVLKPVTPPARRRWHYQRRRILEAWIILIPILIYYAIFGILPVILNMAVSFTDWTGFGTTFNWIGLHNYLAYLRSPYPLIIFNTALFAFFILVIQTVLAFFIAVLLNIKVFGQGLWRAFWYIPTLTSAAIIAQIVTIFIDPFGGVLNVMLKSIHLAPVIWQTDALWMRVIIIGVSIWRGLGGPIVLFLAALQGISRELYEAAQVDGATSWNMLRYITVPLLRPMILFVLVTSCIGGFQIFEAVYLISKGGPFNLTNVMLVQIYNDAFINNGIGVASAGAMVMMLILLGFSITSMRLLQRG